LVAPLFLHDGVPLLLYQILLIHKRGVYPTLLQLKGEVRIYLAPWDVRAYEHVRLA
jgi:hypothetical protein